MKLDRFKYKMYAQRSFDIISKRNLKKLFRLIGVVSSFSIFQVSNGQDLETFLEEALHNNPEIQKFEIQYKLASEKVHEARSLPNTEFGLGIPISSPETRTGPQRIKVSAKQKIPWFGVITARKNYASTLAEAEYEQIVIAKRKLIASVSRSYYDLYAIGTQQKVVEENIALLQTYETLALTAIETGKASAVDVLRLQIRQNELIQLKKVLEQHYNTEQSHFNTLLNRDRSVAVNGTLLLEMPLESNEVPIDRISLHPELVRYDKLFQSVEKSQLLHRKERNPFIGFGVEYTSVTEGPITTFDDNGKDILIPSLSLSIPIFNTKHASKIRQDEWKQKEIMTQKEARLKTLESLLDKAINNRMIARIRYGTAGENLDRAKDAEQILIKNYETGSIDFNDVLEVQELQLKFQMNQITSLQTYYEQSTIIEYLTYK